MRICMLCPAHSFQDGTQSGNNLNLNLTLRAEESHKDLENNMLTQKQ